MAKETLTLTFCGILYLYGQDRHEGGNHFWEIIDGSSTSCHVIEKDLVQVEALEVLESARRCNVDVDDDRADGYVVDDESSLSTNNSMFPEDENLDSDWYIDCALFSPEDVGIAPIVPTVTPSSVFSSLPDLTPESSLSSQESGLFPH